MLLFLLAEQPPTDFWHDPLTLTIIGVIATLLAGATGAFVTYLIFRKQVTKKILSPSQFFWTVIIRSLM